MTYDLEELEQLEQTATPGEWSALEPWPASTVGDIASSIRESGFNVMGSDGHNVCGPLWEHDAELIVAMRNAFPELLADLRRERERVDKLENELESARKMLSEDADQRCREYLQSQARAGGYRTQLVQAQERNVELKQENELLRQPYESYTEDGEAVLPRGWVAVDGGRLDELEADSAENERLRTANAELLEALRPFAQMWDENHRQDFTRPEPFEHAAEVLRNHGGEE